MASRMSAKLQIEKRDSESRLVAISPNGETLREFSPPDTNSEFLYIGSEVGVADVSGKPVVIVSYFSGHEPNGHSDWQFTVNLKTYQLKRVCPWH